MSALREVPALGAQAPDNILELRAAEQRRRIERAFTELRQTAAQRTDLNHLARSHVWQAVGIAALLGLVAGYGTGGWFAP